MSTSVSAPLCSVEPRLRDIHVSRQACLVTDLGNKDMFLGFSYLRRHNPEIDWNSREWLYSRCSDTCHFTGRQAQVAQAELDEPMDKDFKEDEEL